MIGQSIPIVPRYTGLPALTVSPPQVSLAGPASAVFAQADTLIGPVMAGGAQASTLAAMAAAGAGATEGAGHSEQGGETAGPGGKGGGGFGEEPNNSSKSNAKDPRIQSNPSGTQDARLALGRSEVGVGEYLAKKAPRQVAPGVRVLNGQYLDDLGRVQPWVAHYDQYGRLIARTDYNAGDPAQGIANVHHHVYRWGPGMTPLEVQSHVPGEYRP